MVSGFFTSPCDQERIFSGDASRIRMASNVMGFGCRSRIPHRSLVGFSSLSRLPSGRSVNIREPPFPLLLAVLLHELHIERQALQLLHQHVEGLRSARLEAVSALDDGLVDGFPPPQAKTSLEPGTPESFNVL